MYYVYVYVVPNAYLQHIHIIIQHSFSSLMAIHLYMFGTHDISLNVYHYTNLTFVSDVRPSVRAGGHGKPFDLS